MTAAITVDGVSKSFRINVDRVSSIKERVLRAGRTQHQEFWALNEMSFEVGQGETIGILGHNGSGKSTLLKCVAGILKPTTGEIRLRGRVASLLELGSGFHPDLTGRENVYINASFLGISRKEIERRFDEIVAFAEIEQFIDNQVKHYSSGMYVRLGLRRGHQRRPRHPARRRGAGRRRRGVPEEVPQPRRADAGRRQDHRARHPRRRHRPPDLRSRHGASTTATSWPTAPPANRSASSASTCTARSPTTSP